MARFILLLSLLTALMVPVPAAAQQSELPAVQFGLVGLARLQTARLNVVNTLPPNVPPNPCHVSLKFLNEQGGLFARATAEADLLPGQATQLNLPASTAFQNSSASRKLFRASVETQPGPPEFPPSPCAGIVSTLEMFDNLTGRLVSFYQNPGPPEVSLSPGPPDVYGMLGLARLQSAVLTVINLTQTSDSVPTACAVSLTFLDQTGRMFSSGRAGEPLVRRVDLLPGQFASLTLPSSLVFSDNRELRKAFRASVETSPGPPDLPPGPCAGLVNTLELIDTLTARTQLVYSAGASPGAPQ